MKHISGHVCLAEILTHGNFSIQILYGRSHCGRVLYGNIEGNGFLVFGDEAERDLTSNALSSISFIRRVTPAFLRMDIAQTQAENKTLAEENSLAVIACNPETRLQHLCGPILGSRPVWGVLPCALMTHTNHTPFDDYSKACTIAQEIKRIQGYEVQIATFHLDLDGNIRV